jgi:hypothetical protein
MLRRRLALAVLLCVFFFVHEVVLYVEPFLSPSCAWSDAHSGGGAVVHYLVVSDPQLQGKLWESSALGWLTRGDADLHIWKVFNLALWFLQPAAVLVLGDLLDEGYPASASEFDEYARRFQAIFRCPASTPVVSLAGDNDVGGEGNDVEDAVHVSRFEARFGRLNRRFRLNGLPFAAIDTLALTHGDEPFLARTTEFVQTAFAYDGGGERLGQEDGPARPEGPPPILLSHIPVRWLRKDRKQLVLRQTGARLILSGHTHHRQLYAYDTEAGADGGGSVRSDPDAPTVDGRAADAHPIQEYTAPTISYRMGTSKVGVGLVSVSADGLTAGFAECWAPARYPSLLQYGVVGGVLAAGAAVAGCRRRGGRGQGRKKRKAAMKHGAAR